MWEITAQDQRPNDHSQNCSFKNRISFLSLYHFHIYCVLKYTDWSSISNCYYLWLMMRFVLLITPLQNRKRVCTFIVICLYVFLSKNKIQAELMHCWKLMQFWLNACLHHWLRSADPIEIGDFGFKVKWLWLKQGLKTTKQNR